MKFGFSGQNLAYFSCEAETDTEAIEIAEAHFGAAIEGQSGRWEERDEGEDENGEICYIHYGWETPLFVLSFASHRYPEDNRMFGIFSTKEKAEERMKTAIECDRSSHPNHPRRYQQNESYYSIDEYYIDE